MDMKTLTADLSVSTQITAADVATIAAQGFKSILCNRPDGEGADQTAFAEIEAQAKALGLAVAYQPVVSGAVTDQDGADFAAVIADLPAPVFAYCRTGTRCTILWALSQAAQQPVDGIVTTAAEAGYDLSKMAGRLQGLAGASAA